MVHPQDVNGRDGLQIWRVVAKTLNKQPWTVDKGWSSSLRFGFGANNFSPKKKKLDCYEHSEKTLTWIDSLDNRPKRWNMDMRFGTWNIRSL
jgi:hypothetical protein